MRLRNNPFPVQGTSRVRGPYSNGRHLKVVDVEVRYIGEDGRPLSAKEFLDQLTQLLPGLFERGATEGDMGQSR
ncbi:MAG TPA: hypothetical protein VFV68_15515 [Agriterribacter sp.]|nr:hypothetical protein [Agriterribacter sp.]